MSTLYGLIIKAADEIGISKPKDVQTLAVCMHAAYVLADIDFEGLVRSRVPGCGDMRRAELRVMVDAGDAQGLAEMAAVVIPELLSELDRIEVKCDGKLERMRVNLAEAAGGDDPLPTPVAAVMAAVMRIGSLEERNEGATNKIEELCREKRELELELLNLRAFHAPRIRVEP